MEIIKKLHADRIIRKISPSYRLKRKHESEMTHWREELLHVEEWFLHGSTDWWGIRPPAQNEKLNVSELWQVNAVMTMHSMRPSYWEELRLDQDFFAGKRVLEIGSGPLAPILQFANCERHGIDPLVNMYVAAGWPLYGYDAKFLSIGGESLPYPDGYFDAVISVNALDHVDNFELVASEMERVLKRGGGVYFEVEYHPATVAEPIVLDNDRVFKAFPKCDLSINIERTGREMFGTLANRFNLMKERLERFGSEPFVTFHGVRK